MDRLACPCCGVAGCTPELIMALKELERKSGPLTVTSGYRCEQHQANLRQAWIRGRIEWRRMHGGLKFPDPEPALHSQHSTGKAIDVLCKKEKQLPLIALAMVSGFRGIGVGSGMLHFDIRDTAAEWRY